MAGTQKVAADCTADMPLMTRACSEGGALLLTMALLRGVMVLASAMIGTIANIMVVSAE
jgi:hypothetical protein